ncbi:MAG: malto-oligosyltrehalose synthase [Desulfohalobiaceae bacterium]
MPIPQSTYRLQLHPGFPFQAAEEIADYLRDLGITHIYASPITAARPGSEHGYDQIDPCRINPELGGAEGFDRLQRRCGETGLGWIQDIVPNHMAYSADNSRLADVLEKGPLSRYAGHFEIRWHHPHPALSGRLSAPFLGAPYSECLENGDLGLDFREGSLLLRYFDVRLPLCPESYPLVLERALERLLQDSPEAAAGLEQALLVCRGQHSGGAERAASLLRDLYGDNTAFRQWLDHFLERANAAPRSLEWIRFLDRINRSQHFAPVHWEMAGKAINYRRFFSINDLICLRQDRREVLEDTHSLVLRLAKKGRLQGLRIDHLDGMTDPQAYLRQLRRHLPETYLVAEKILAPEEVPPATWPIQGTTGYDFLLHLTGVLCDPSGKNGFDALYAELDPEESRAGAEKIPEQKGHILEGELGGDLENLTRELAKGICATPLGSDLSLGDLRKAVAALASAFPVYRTYVRQGPPSGADGAYLCHALQRARRRNPSVSETLARLERFVFASSGELGSEAANARDGFLRQLQQTTGPLAAKGVEDTHLYTYNRLASLNEVGGDPHRFGLSPEAFHAFMRHRARCWTHSMNASATHDTKRGEDVRARLNSLSEMPEIWASHVREWRELNRGFKTDLGGRTAPDGNEEYLLYQTLVGTFPFTGNDFGGYKQRIRDYMVKALREAKRNTSWHRVNPDWEKACLDFLDAILPDDGSGPSSERFIPFQQKIAHLGMINSLAQVLVKMAVPGVPDVYQGTELWDLNLVDPDNRREVDFSARRRYLERIHSGLEEDPEALFREMYERPETGMLKMHVLHRGLLTRREHAALFRDGEYFPVSVEGPLREHILAFCRRRGKSLCLAVAPRLPAGLVSPPDWPLGREVWGETRIRLPEGASRLRDQLTLAEHPADKTLNVGDLLQYLPVCLLVAVTK